MQRGHQACDNRWLGSHKNEVREGAFYTNCRLAEKFCEIVHAHRGDDELYEMGVGEGAIFARLHEPKTGVELQGSIKQKFPSVAYGVDALTVTPPPSEDAGRHVTVVMNPPFNRYREFFNHASTFANRIAWIVGPNARLWTNEDGLNSNMHLVSEWLVPDDMSDFTLITGKRRKVKSIVQIWEWRSQPRRLWNLKSCLKGIRGQQVVRGAYVVKKVGKKDVGMHLKLSGHESDEEIARIGTLRKQHGTALIIHDHPSLQLLEERVAGGVFQDLMRHRSTPLISLSLVILSNILSDDWESLKRPIQYLDGKQRYQNQW